MKIRNGFVSNSSSSSFILALTEEQANVLNLVISCSKISENEIKEYINDDILNIEIINKVKSEGKIISYVDVPWCDGIDDFASNIENNNLNIEILYDFN